MAWFRIWRARRVARLLSRYEKEQDIAALFWRGGEKYTVGLFRNGAEL